MIEVMKRRRSWRRNLFGTFDFVTNQKKRIFQFNFSLVPSLPGAPVKRTEFFVNIVKNLRSELFK